MSERYDRPFVCVAALTIGWWSACERVPLTSPTGSTISLSIDRASCP